MNRLQLFFSFRGRIGRRAYAAGVVVVALGLLLATALSCSPRLAGASDPEAAVAAFLAALQEQHNPMVAAAGVGLWAAFALAAKRLHDIGKSAWSVVGANLFLTLAAGAAFCGAFKYDDLLNDLNYAALFSAFLYGAWMAFLMLVCEGDGVANDYGPRTSVNFRIRKPAEGRVPRKRKKLTSIVQKRHS